MVRCPPPLRRGATAASSPHSASWLYPVSLLLRPTPRALRGALLHQPRGGSPAAAPPRGGSPAAARGTHHEGARWPPRGEPAPAVVLLPRRALGPRPSPGPACSGRPRPRRLPRPPSRRHLLLRPPRNLRVASAMQTNALRGYERGEAALSARGPASRWLPGRSPARESMMAQHCLPVTHPVARLRKFFRRAVTSSIPPTQPWTWDESALARGAYTPCAQPPPHCPPPQLFHLAKLPLSPVNDAGERCSGARMQVTRRNATAGCC